MDQDGFDRLVLVAEDDSIASALLVDVLEAEGFSVVEVRTGRAALCVLDAGLRPSLVITDLAMPDLDGWALLAALERLPRPAPQVLVLTSPAGLKQAEGLEARYGCRVLRKPDGLAEVAGLALRASVGARSKQTRSGRSPRTHASGAHRAA